jgi:glycosyltransferase involved in cell wall biosynthesis
MYVANDVASDTRVLREADTLAEAGHDVTLIGRLPAASSLPAAERRASGARIVRVSGDDGWLARWRAELAWIRYPWRARGEVVRRIGRHVRRGPAAWPRALGIALGALVAIPWVLYRLVAWGVFRDRLPAPAQGGQLDYIVGWRRSVLPWAEHAALAGKGAQVHHGHDVTGLAAAVRAAALDQGRVVYDSHELYAESGRHARQGRWAKRWIRGQERSMARQAVALVTVNATLEGILRDQLGLKRSVVVHNAPPRWTAPDPAPDLLRAKLGLAPGTKLVLYHGGMTAERGLLPLVDALERPEMADVHLVLMGSGALRGKLETRANGPKAGGRIHVIDPVPPDDLAAWVASADVGAMPNLPMNANERLSTPNKLFESIAVGLPVVSSDFPERKRIILGDPDGPLGAVCDPAKPEAIARAIRSILDLAPDARADLHRRILHAAHERWNWEIESAKLAGLYESLVGGDAPMTAPVPDTRPRAVLLVANAAAPYSRGLRVARSLAEAGYAVEIAAVDDGAHAIEQSDAGVLVHRYPPRGPWVKRATPPAGPAKGLRRWIIRGHRAAGKVIPPLRRFPAPTSDALSKIFYWPVHVRAWWAALEAELPPADLYHAFGILTIDVANRLAADAKKRGREGKVVYDVIDVILDSNNYGDVPGPILRLYKWRERRWLKRADAVVTVNQPIADHLDRIWPVREPVGVLLNCQPRWTPPEPRPDHIRAATGIPPERKIVLWLGRLGRERGLEQAADAVLQLDDAALVMLGFGPWADQLRAQDQSPKYKGRHFTLPPVHPDEVPAWTSSADVSVIAVPANSLNQRLSTPNKFWESLTAGTPIVLGRDLEVMRAMLEAHDLGRVADPASPDDLARALREVLEQGDDALGSMRARCLVITRDEWNWETAVQPYLALVAGLRKR